MPVRVAINGYGRIGRQILRAYLESYQHSELEIVAINDLAPLATLAHLTRFDSVHGPLALPVETDATKLRIAGHSIAVSQQACPQELPWQALQVDIVLECSGGFNHRAGASQHLQAGANKVLVSAPAGADVDATVVYGVNHDALKSQHRIVSNASCTTNCLAPLVLPLHNELQVVSGLMTTVHAYTNDQTLSDSPHQDLRRARAAAQSMIPTKTGAAASIGLVLPELAGKLDGIAVRVPTPNVSLVDLTVQVATEPSVAAVNTLLEQAAAGPLQGIAAVNQAPLVSVDFNHHPASSVFDLTQTKVQGQLVKVLAWYDNEWAFAHRMLDVARVMCR